MNARLGLRLWPVWAMMGAMKVLVQDRNSQRFLGGKGKWLADHDKAINFEGILRAVEAVWEYGFSQVRILLRKPDGEMSVLMEVGARA